MGAGAGLVEWDSPSGPPSNRVWPALDGAETPAVSTLRGTTRSPRQTQLTESAYRVFRPADAEPALAGEHSTLSGDASWRRCGKR